MSLEGKVASNESLIRQLFEAGAHFGYSRTRNHPSTKKAVFTYKNRSAIIDLEKTAEALERAKTFLRELGRENKVVLWVGNKDEAKAPVSKIAESLNSPYVASRWLGGTFTNFSQIKSRIDRLAKLKGERESGELAKYTKKERLMIDKEIAKLERYLATLSLLEKLPSAVVVVDAEHEKIVVTESLQLKIPVIAICGTDNNIGGLDYPIVANDANMSSVSLILNQLSVAYEEGKHLPPPEPTITEEVATVLSPGVAVRG